VDERLLKNLLCCLSKNAFEAFVLIFFNDNETRERFEPFPEIGDGAFRKELLDSYGGSIHALYLLHFAPVEVFNRPKDVIVYDPTIMGKLRRIADHYKGKMGQWGMVSPHLVPGKALNELYFLNNFANITESECRERIIPRYRKMLKTRKLNPKIYGVGCCDSFVERSPDSVDKALKTLLSQKPGGLRICFQEETHCVERFSYQKSFFTGVSRHTRQPYEPVLTDILTAKEEVIAEFERLIRKGAKESELENFIRAHYNDIFGARYDRIETQLWLRFPEHDIGGKDRRLDLFLRNSVKNDWELFEVKRPVKVTRTYRDAPVIAHEVSHAVQQVRNYAKILAQDSVKKQFAKEGIEYYEPSLNLVIGRTPEIPLRQWRWLMNTFATDLRIFTFDELVTEMEVRLRDLYRITGMNS